MTTNDIITTILAVVVTALSGFVLGFYRRYKWDIRDLDERCKWNRGDVYKLKRDLARHVDEHKAKELIEKAETARQSWIYKEETDAHKEN